MLLYAKNKGIAQYAVLETDNHVTFCNAQQVTVILIVKFRFLNRAV